MPRTMFTPLRATFPCEEKVRWMAQIMISIPTMTLFQVAMAVVGATVA